MVAAEWLQLLAVHQLAIDCDPRIVGGVEIEAPFVSYIVPFERAEPTRRRASFFHRGTHGGMVAVVEEGGALSHRPIAELYAGMFTVLARQLWIALP